MGLKRNLESFSFVIFGVSQGYAPTELSQGDYKGSPLCYFCR